MKRLGEQGFTLLNGLLELMVLMIFLPLVILFFGFMVYFSAEIDAQTAEWHLFTVDFQSYLEKVESVEVINNGGGVRLVRQDEEYDIEKYDRFIRKQKYRQGHEVMLTDVKSLQFKVTGAKLLMRTEFYNGAVEDAEYIITYAKEQ